MDTGSQVSLWPPSSTTPALKNIQSNVRLTAANGTPIASFGKQLREIKIGGKIYSFVFIIVQIMRPILGLDFLQRFKMSIDLCSRWLLHSGTLTRFSSASSKISGINVIHTRFRIRQDPSGFSGSHRHRPGFTYVETQSIVFHPHEWTSDPDSAKAAVPGQVEGREEIFRRHEGRGHLPVIGLTMELRAPHGPQEGWNGLPLRRLPLPE